MIYSIVYEREKWGEPKGLVMIVMPEKGGDFDDTQTNYMLWTGAGCRF